MKFFARYIILFIFAVINSSLYAQSEIVLGHERLKEYLPQLKGMKVGLVVNHSSVIEDTHLVDSLIALGVDVKKVFAPEHGFRGKADAGEHLENGIDKSTGLPIVSLYGNNKKPSVEQLSDIDCVVFDIQDVGVRFYTYISTMHYVMEACAENGKTLIVLDRPNPNGSYVDGPVLDTNFRSFVGMHPIPIVHGLTVGELALMINGERWLNNRVQCDLKVISCLNYKHSDVYQVMVKPSPNLPNHNSIVLYPSLCLFEPTQISVGRGTYYPFQVIGAPQANLGSFEFTPISIEGMSKHPKHENVKCYGYNFLKERSFPTFTVKYLVEYYEKYEDKAHFFTSESFFNKLAGNDILIEQIRSGLSEEEIKKSWQKDLADYNVLRAKYALYSLD